MPLNKLKQENEMINKDTTIDLVYLHINHRKKLTKNLESSFLTNINKNLY